MDRALGRKYRDLCSVVGGVGTTKSSSKSTARGDSVRSRIAEAMIIPRSIQQPAITAPTPYTLNLNRIMIPTL